MTTITFFALSLNTGFFVYNENHNIQFAVDTQEGKMLVKSLPKKLGNNPHDSWLYYPDQLAQWLKENNVSYIIHCHSGAILQG